MAPTSMPKCGGNLGALDVFEGLTSSLAPRILVAPVWAAPWITFP